MAFHTEGLQERSSFKFVIRYIKYPILYANYSEIRFRIFSHAFLLKCKKLDASTVLRWKHPAEPVRSLKLITLDKFALWTLKGQCHEIFKNKISHESNPSRPLINRLFKMDFLKIRFREDIRILSSKNSTPCRLTLRRVNNEVFRVSQIV